MSEEKKKREIPIEGIDSKEEAKANEETSEDTENEDSKETKAEEKKDKPEKDEEKSGNEDESTEEVEKSTDSAEESEEDTEAVESERYMRLMAEFQNFKRRAAKEKTEIHAFANERIVSDILPVLDNFERALDSGKEGQDTGNAEDISGTNEELANYAKGMQLIFEQLWAALEKAGLKEIEALGEDFDPNVHNAVMTEQTDEFEDGKVSKVMQKGYKLNDKVVRPAMVAVNKL